MRCFCAYPTWVRKYFRPWDLSTDERDKLSPHPQGETEIIPALPTVEP